MTHDPDWGAAGRPVSGSAGGPVRAGVYVRVFSAPSDPVRDRLSLEAQLTWCVEECERRGWSLVESYTELGVADPADGPARQRALEAAAGGALDVLVTARADRIASGGAELADLAARLAPVVLVAGDQVVGRPESRGPGQPTDPA